MKLSLAKSLVGNLVLLKWLGMAGVGFALLIASWAIVGDAQGPVMRYWQRYCGFLERKLRLMFMWTPGWYIAAGQVAAVFAIIAIHLAFKFEAWWVLLIIAIGGPPWYVERLRRKRVELIETQLDTFLTALANALKATPSIGNAFVSIQPLLPLPIQTEVELACKEMRVGSTLDQALLNMGGRIGSRQLDSALSSILIGRQVGGDMPRILETTAGTMREMLRLEGVVQTKTAEGKAQLWVLACVPFALTAMLNWMQPGYFDPLRDSFIGWVLLVIAGICWLASLLLARKVLTVDV
jgi:tight adherence protein B